MKQLTTFLLWLVCIAIHAQQPFDEASIFEIISKQDTIRFIKTDNDLTTKKPTIIFCQGSQPIPLFIGDEQNNFIPALCNFDYKKISKDYHIILISMPHTPILVNDSLLNNNSAFVTDISKPESFDTLYMRYNYLENYVRRGNTVIKHLKKQKWVEKRKIVVVGHSQGAQVALNLAVTNPDIYALGYFSGNIEGRFTQFIRNERNQVKRGNQTQFEAQNKIDSLYHIWQLICRKETEYGDGSHTWKSFSQNFVSKMTSLKMPVFITYGTEDPASEGCDYLPIYFEMANKTNYKIKPFVRCGHNFEEVTADGKHNWEKIHWQEAIDAFLLFIENQ